ncbi:MAG: hypothetical protein R3D69_13125 [Xanthobacteraceae bacterium]
MAKKPNILFFHVDNLGMGELGCYGGGILREVDTESAWTSSPRKAQKLTHYVVEPQCTPTRSALMIRPLPDPLRQPHDCPRRQWRRHRHLGTHDRLHSVGSRLYDVDLRQVAHRSGRRPFPDRPRF